jgi:hypothetical protein
MRKRKISAKEKRGRKTRVFSDMRRLLMQPPIDGNLLPEWPMSRARFARRAAVADS